MFFFFTPNGSVRQLKTLASISAGISVTRLVSDESAPAVPVISVSDVEEDLRPRKELSTAHANFDTLKKFQVQTNDVIVTTRGADIRAAVVKETHHGAIAGANLAIVRLHGSLLPALLAAFLRQPQTRTTLLERTIGASTPGFTIKDLGELSIRVPPQDQQLTIARLIDSTRAYRAAMTKAVEFRGAACNEIIGRALTPSAEAHE